MFGKDNAPRARQAAVTQLGTMFLIGLIFVLSLWVYAEQALANSDIPWTNEINVSRTTVLPTGEEYTERYYLNSLLRCSYKCLAPRKRKQSCTVRTLYS